MGRSATPEGLPKGRERPLLIMSTLLFPVRMTVIVVVRCESLDIATVGIHNVDLILRIHLRLIRASIAI